MSSWIPLTEEELKSLEDAKERAYARNSSFAQVPCSMLGMLIAEVRERRRSLPGADVQPKVRTENQ